MSIICATPGGYVISHEIIIEKVYKNVQKENTVVSLRFQNDIFKIETPFKSDDKIKRKKKKSVPQEESGLVDVDVNVVKISFNKIVQAAKNKGLLHAPISETSSGNAQAKELAKSFFEDSANWKKSFFLGSNNLVFPVIKKINGENYVFPEKCIFYCYDVELIQEKLIPLNIKYDFILLDPPWWNKYVRRQKSKCVQSSYKMMYNEDLKNIPVPALLAEDGLVAVWCTNSQQNVKFLVEVIFPAWGFKYIGKWIWVKITQSGEPVCVFSDPPRKQPFERLIFGCFSNTSLPRRWPLPEDGKLIVSVPSAIHSHKPPLSELMSICLPPEPNCFEIFARYLLPAWTSWGNEVLKLQHTSLYETNSS